MAGILTRTVIAAGLCVMLPFHATAQSSIGMIKMGSDDGWFLYSTRRVNVSDVIVAQFLDSAGHVNCCIRVRAQGLSNPSEDDAAMDALSDQTVLRYKLVPAPDKKIRQPFVGIAVIGNASKVTGARDAIEVTDAGGKVTAFSCLGSEGINVLARSGAQLISHLYLGVGYSITPTCTDTMLQ